MRTTMNPSAGSSVSISPAAVAGGRSLASSLQTRGAEASTLRRHLRACNSTRRAIHGEPLQHGRGQRERPAARRLLLRLDARAVQGTSGTSLLQYAAMLRDESGMHNGSADVGARPAEVDLANEWRTSGAQVEVTLYAAPVPVGGIVSGIEFNTDLFRSRRRRAAGGAAGGARRRACWLARRERVVCAHDARG